MDECSEDIKLHQRNLGINKIDLILLSCKPQKWTWLTMMQKSKSYGYKREKIPACFLLFILWKMIRMLRRIARAKADTMDATSGTINFLLFSSHGSLWHGSWFSVKLPFSRTEKFRDASVENMTKMIQSCHKN